MKLHTSLLSAVALVASAAACSSQRDAASVLLDGQVDTSHAVLVYMGGFNSCASSSPDGLYGMAKFNELRTAVQGAGKTVHTLFSCYDGMSSTEIKYKSEGGAVQTARWSDPSPVFDAVKALSQDFRYPIYAVGHSYGGWLASNMTAHFAQGGARGVVRGLYTIDPISPYHCNQGLYAATVAKSLGILTAMGPAGGCEIAPPQYVTRDGRTYPAAIANDADAAFRGLVRQAALEWQSFYQTRDYLHSSAIPATGGFPRNTFVRYYVFLIGTNSAPHVRIHIERQVWSAIVSSVRARLGNALWLQSGDGDAGGTGEGADATIEVRESDDNDATTEAPSASIAQQAVERLAPTAGAEYDPLTEEEESFWESLVAGADATSEP